MNSYARHNQSNCVDMTLFACNNAGNIIIRDRKHSQVWKPGS